VTTNYTGVDLHDWAKERFALLKESADKFEKVVNDAIATESEFRLTLEKSLLSKFDDSDKLYDVIREMSDRASDKAEKAQAAINVAQNEWRTTFQEYTKLTVLRPEFDKQSGDLAAVRLDMEKKFSAQTGEKFGARETKDDSKAMWAMVISVGTFVVVLLVEILKVAKP